MSIAKPKQLRWQWTTLILRLIVWSSIYRGVDNIIASPVRFPILILGIRAIMTRDLVVVVLVVRRWLFISVRVYHLLTVSREFIVTTWMAITKAFKFGAK